MPAKKITIPNAPTGSHEKIAAKGVRPRMIKKANVLNMMCSFVCGSPRYSVKKNAAATIDSANATGKQIKMKNPAKLAMLPNVEIISASMMPPLLNVIPNV